MSEGLSDSGDLRPIPDPTHQTTKQIDLGLSNLRALNDAQRSGNLRVIEANIANLRREAEMTETHRLELKSDASQHRLELKAGDERALSAAMIAADKAVVAALAASEKARDQQTIASQLATSKAEANSTEQLRQQKETFTLSISSLTDGYNDMKGLVAELRTEKRVAADSTTEQHAVVTERRAGSAQIIAIVAIIASLAGGVIGLIVVKLIELIGG